jgi:uncharacterized membrane protein
MKTATPLHVMDRVELTVRWVLFTGLVIGVALMGFGLALVPVRGLDLPTTLPAPGAVVEACLELLPAGYLALGLLVIVATPFVRVIGLIIAFALERDGRFVLIAAVVLVMMSVGVLLGQA